MTQLLAPNGKPSNLTPEQYKLVRTPAFKEWFGDWEKLALTKINDSGIDEISLKRLADGVSKVVDSNGEPLVVYHGSRSEFNVFQIGRTGGIFFTNNRNSAIRFSEGDLKRKGDSPRILECFLNIRKYYYKDTNDEKLVNGYYDEYFNNRPFIKSQSQKNILKDKFNKYFMGLVSFGIVNEEPKDYLLKNGYDSIVIDADNNTKSFIVFESNQIKLADGSNTTFDAGNPDIRYEKGGLIAPNGKPSGLYFTEIYNLVRTKEFKNWFGDWEEAYKTKDYDGVSKIIDENGEPLICVHNTPKEFYEFDEYEIGKNTDAGYYGKGFYFTPNVGQSRYGEIELNCFLNIKNPYFKQSSYRTYELNSDELKNQGYDGVVVYPNWIENMNFENGVDVSEEIVVYYPEQIKLGDGRNTTFDNYNSDIRFDGGGSVSNYREFYDNLQIEDGSKYIGQKFADVFPFVGKNTSPAQIRISVKEYNNLLGRLENDNYTTKGMKTADLNRLEKRQKYIDKKKYLSRFYLDPSGTIIGFDNSDNAYNDGGEVIINPTEIVCHKCHWHWKVKDGGDDLFICHKCYTDNTKYYKFEGLEGKKILDTISYKKGGRTIAQTPAPKKDQIKGSDKNKEGSSKDLKSAKKIELSDSTIEAIKNKVEKHNEKHPKKKITIDSAKAVVRRGMGAYSSSYRPTISGGKPNSRVAWGLARLNSFLYKIVNGKSKSGKYSQDNDLIEELGYNVEKYEIGGIFQGTPHDFDKYSTEYIGTGEGLQVFGWGLYFTDIKDIAKNYAKNEMLIEKEISRKSDDFGLLVIYTNISDSVVDKLGYLKIKLKEFEALKNEYKIDTWDDKIEKYSNLIDIIKNYKGKIYSVTLFKGEKESDYDLIQWEKPLGIDDLVKIFDEAEKIGGIDFKGGWELDEKYGLTNERGNKVTGEEMYRWLSIQLGGDKEASLFLLRAGIDGIKYKAGTLSGMSDAEGYNYVIFDANDVTIENKEKYADGGDIQAYKEAMGITYAEGGEAKPKKVYVSIRLANDYERISGNLHLFKKYKDESFQELKNQKLVGVRGVSLTKDNVADWFANRDCLIVMKYDEFIQINDTTEIKYDDPYQLMANDLKIFSRLYGNSDYTEKKEKDITRRSNLGKILEKIPFYFDKAKYQYLYEDAQKRDELQRYYYILADYKHNFIAWITDNEYIINSPNDLTERLIEFAHLPNSESGIDNYRNFNLEKYVLTTEDLLPIIIQGLKKAGSTYFDEKEVLINDKILNIPTNSQIFFKKSSFENSNLQEVIDRYNLKENYKVYSVDSKRLNDLQVKVIGDRSKIFMNKFEFGKEQLEIKKELVLNDLQKLFLDKSLDKINKILDEKYPSTYYFDWEGEETKYYRWNEVIEVQFLLNKFFDITLREWKSFFRTKRANEIYSMSFYGIYNTIDLFLREFIEQNRDYLENINKYHNENGDYLWLYDIERAVLGVVGTTWDEGNGISDKQLAKKYFQMIGAELTTYYSKDELVIPSIYKEGGEADEPTHFWGTEAGGVLVYCSTTERYLILLRSEWVLEPNTWGIISGKLDDEENVQEAVLREAEEETGHKLGHLIPSFIFEKPNFKFHNFVSIVEEEFTPELDWENSDYRWVKLDEMPENLHFGLKLLLQKEDLPTLVEKNKNTKNKNQMDKNSFNTPLLIRLFELMREEVKSDVALHEIVENIMEIRSKGTLTMSDYDSIVGNVLDLEDNQNTEVIEEEKMAEGGKVESIHSDKGDIKISLDENWYSDDTDVELVPVSELIKFREFDRKVSPKYNKENSVDNINHLKFMFQKDGVKSPLIIEYSKEDNAVLIIEGNHRLNSAIDLGMEYLPARVVLKKYGKYSPEKLKNAMKVSGVEGDQFGYVPSNMKPSKVGIQGTKSLVFADGGIIEGRLHSECDAEEGCGRKFQVGENGHIIEAERDEAVIVADAFESNEELTIKGTPSEVASALNVIGGGKNFDKGATIIKNGQELEIPELKKEATDTDVEDVIDSGSIIINRRSMYDKKEYEVTGTPKQIASAINSINGNGVVIEKGAEIKEN